jgi:hypothetical protein
MVGCEITRSAFFVERISLYVRDVRGLRKKRDGSET